jgi:hypothetical protein
MMASLLIAVLHKSLDKAVEAETVVAVLLILFFSFLSAGEVTRSWVQESGNDRLEPHEKVH